MFRVVELTCEYAHSPLGVQTSHPRFSWQLRHSGRGQRQSAYRILVASSRRRLATGRSDLWDSGKVAGLPGADNCLVEYRGAPLGSAQMCWWTVRAWDAQGRPSPWAQPASFETGLLRPEDWEGRWIGYPPGWHGAALHFRRTFEVPGKIVRGRAYLAGLGTHELHVNGRRIGQSVLDPAQSVYDKRVLYVAYDLTRHLRRGANTLGVIVGYGWYGSRKLLLQLNADLAGGGRFRLASQPGPFSWTVGMGPITAHGIFDGETYDARLADDGWATPAYDRRRRRRMQWSMAMGVEPPGGRLVAQQQPPMRVVQTLLPRKVTRPRAGVHVFDMGWNLAGWALLRVRAPAGTQIRLRFAESLRADGLVNQDNLYVARATDTYVARGRGLEQYEPRTTYHGFRYVQVEGLPARPRTGTLRARAVRTATVNRGHFACDSELLNRIHLAVVRTEASNQHGVPTDCPQRAERMGWLNDLTARSEQAALNFDVGAFYAKFADDLGDAADARGAVPDTVPLRWGFQPADPVCIAYLLLPWLTYRHWGDRRALAEHFEGMKAWVEHLQGLAQSNILEFSRWGDWSEPGGHPTRLRPPNSRRTPGAVVSTGFLAFHWALLARIADVLGRRADARAARRQSAAVKAAFNRRFWDDRRGVYGTGSQACNALALSLGMAPADRASRAAQALADDVRRHGFHLTTGNICTKYLLESLSDHGYHDVACRLAAQTTYPSWGFMLSLGATTIWERWEHATGGQMNSHNHPMLASVGSWFYKHLAGLDVAPDACGSDRFVVTVSKAYGVNRASARLQTARGPAGVAWVRGSGRLRVEVEIPVNASATVRLAEATGAGVFESGKEIWPPAAKLPPGVLSIRKDHGDVLIEIGSGRFRFVAHPL